MNDAERLRRYREFLYEVGAGVRRQTTVNSQQSAVKSQQSTVNSRQSAANTWRRGIDASVVEKERKANFELSRARRFMYRTRYFTDSGIIGGKTFVIDTYRKIQGTFQYKRDKIPKLISGLGEIYSLKRLVE